MKKAIPLIMLCAALTFTLAACTGNAGGAGSVKTVRVGTMGTYPPFSITDDSGNLTGYDIEVLRLLDTRMEDIEFQYIQMGWDSLFLSLDTDKLDMVVNQISRTPEREEKYLFEDEGYFYALTQVVIREDDDTHQNLADFSGEVMGGIIGDAFTEIIEQYNEENGNPFTIQYYPDEYLPIFVDLDAGRIAGTVNDTIVVQDAVKELGLKIKCVGDIIESSPSYFAIRSDDLGKEIKASIDKAMTEVLADGSLKDLSIEWFGEDYTQKR